MSEHILNFDLEADQRLTSEMFFAEDNLSQAIGNYLLEKFKTDPVLKNCYKERKITLEATTKFVYDCATKKLGSKNGAISDDEVFGWVLHYVQDEKVSISKEKSQTIHTAELSEEEKQELTKKAEEEFLKKEKEKLEKKQQAKIQKEKKKLEESGQLTLFDF